MSNFPKCANKNQKCKFSKFNFLIFRFLKKNQIFKFFKIKFLHEGGQKKSTMSQLSRSPRRHRRLSPKTAGTSLPKSGRHLTLGCGAVADPRMSYDYDFMK